MEKFLSGLSVGLLTIMTCSFICMISFKALNREQYYRCFEQGNKMPTCQYIIDGTETALNKTKAE